MTSLKDLIERYKDEILELHKEKTAKAEICRWLIQEHKLDVPFDKVDSFRRGISKFIEAQEEQELQDMLVEPLTTEEKHIAEDLNENIQDWASDEALDEEDVLDDSEFEESLRGAYEHKEKFWFVSETDSYYFNIPSYAPGMKISGTLIRELKNMYSYLGRQGGMTINQICRAVKLPRVVILYIKTYLGWTHDSDPFTNEEMLSGDLDEMVDRTLEDRKFQWFQKYTRSEQKLVADAANKWWQFKGKVINPFAEKMIESMDDYHARKVEKFKPVPGEAHALVVGPYDLHFGKYAWEGDTANHYDRQKAREALLESTKAIISEVRNKNIDKVIIPCGSDFFHCDTLQGTTTRGTPQDLDGTLIQIMVEGNRLMIEFVDLLRQVANVELILAAGNHDYVLAHQLLEHLGAYYRNCEDVTVVKCYQFRQYALYGNSLLGFTHGDETKLTDLPLLMATEAKELWAQAVHKAFFTGHLHHEMSKDIKGVKIFQTPSLAGTDRWHHKKGYVGSVKGLAAYLVHKTKGVRITLMENL